MSRNHQLLWFVAMYVASIAAFAFLTFSVRKLMLLAQHLA